VWNKSSLELIDISPLDLSDYYNEIKEKLIDYNWFVGFGTALGLYRDKNTIPKDTDIDICILETDQDRIVKIKELFSELVRFSVDNDKIQQLCFQGKDRVLIDICFFYPVADDLVNIGESGTYVDKKDIIGDIQFIDTKYGKLPFPEHIEKYLEWRYGDWQTPKYGLITSSLTQ